MKDKKDILTMVEIEQKLMNNEPVPGVFKINDDAEEVKDKSQSQMKTMERPWLK